MFGDANEKGLYHTKTRKEFCDTLSALEKKWNAEEGEVRKRLKLSPVPKFAAYFRKNKSEKMYLYFQSEVALEANIYHHKYLNTN